MVRSPAHSAAERVYAHVKEGILSGRVAGGELLGEADVARELDVSRTPVRESFIRLESEGWMTLYPRRGALVHEISPREVHELVQARVLIESGSVRACVAEKRHEQLARTMAALLETQRAALEAADHDAFTNADAVFHHALVTAAGNSLLEGFFGTLKDRQRRVAAHALSGESERSAAVLDEHDALIEAVRAGDVARFEDLLREHLDVTYSGFLDR